MKRKLLLFTLLSTATIMISSCSGDSKKTSDDNTTATTTEKGKEASGKSLVEAPSAPSGVTFEAQDFEGMGTMQFPSGADWQQDGNKRYNEKLEMIIVTQSQDGSMLDMQEEYVQSYIENNFRDATNYKLGNREKGTINGIAANRVAGSFNNGTDM